MLRLYLWGRFRSPRRIREVHFDFGWLPPTVMLPFGVVMQEVARGFQTSRRLMRDVLFAWNNDWRKPADSVEYKPQQEAATQKARAMPNTLASE